MLKTASTLLSCVLLSACGTPPAIPSPTHLRQPSHPDGTIPQPVRQSATIRPPKPAPKAETYSVTVHKVPVQSLLFALARDARINIDIHPGIEGEVTLNALDQTLPQLLNRISTQVNMRYTLDGQNLAVLPDTPFLRNYKVDYLNMTRLTASKVSIATQISTTGAAGAGGGSGDNNSTTSVTNASNNNFWEILEKNIRDILREADRMVIKSRSESIDQLPPGSDQAAAAKGAGAPAATASAPAPLATTTLGNSGAPAGASQQPGANQQVSENERAAHVIVNAVNGLIAVRATARQHQKVQEFLDLVMASARRQVLIEATVIEVQLNDNYQQGINWGNMRAEGTSIMQAPVGGVALPSGVNPGAGPGAFLLKYANPSSRFGNLAATIQLLESFGKVKVLSSPKISVLNNQTAMLKVVDNRVYFTITATTTAGTAGSPTISTYTSELHTVPVGFVMSVTPQITDTDEVTINVRPSISRIVAFVQDPNPALANALVPVVSNVPVIQTREMESMLKVSSGQIAVMGGLMQDTVNNLKDGIPGISKVPFLGDALSYRNETVTKSELVIFMRPVVVKDASIQGDYQDYRYLLPDQTALNRPPSSEVPPAARSAGADGAGS
jgi:MSHA biogenesis protein MshL